MEPFAGSGVVFALQGMQHGGAGIVRLPCFEAIFSFKSREPNYAYPSKLQCAEMQAVKAKH